VKQSNGGLALCVREVSDAVCSEKDSGELGTDNPPTDAIEQVGQPVKAGAAGDIAGAKSSAELTLSEHSVVSFTSGNKAVWQGRGTC
jgi:hypothetical protein